MADVSKVDWKDEQSVVSACKRLGPACMVYKLPTRTNYNITFIEHAVRVMREGAMIVYPTGDRFTACYLAAVK
jgi:hypothetical protein